MGGGGGGGPEDGSRGPAEDLSGNGGGVGGEGAAGGGGGGAGVWGARGAPLPGPTFEMDELDLPGGGFNGGIPWMANFSEAESSVDVITVPAIFPIGILISESICEFKYISRV